MIYDVLHSAPADPGELDFVADAGALQVLLNPPTYPPGINMPNSSDLRFFLGGDNLLLSKIRMNIPYGFGQGTGIHRLKFLWVSELGVVQNIPELATYSLVDIPDICAGLEFPGAGLFIKVPVTESFWEIRLTEAHFNVSMVNLPTDLDGQTVLATYFMEVAHTLPMQTPD